VQEQALPGDAGPPIVADQDGRLLAERVDKADNIGRELVDVVVLDSRWLDALSVAAQIRLDDMIALARAWS
jgi:hypothetical protein